MSSFITAIIGIASLLASMFFSFGTGIELERNGDRSEAVVGDFLLAALFGLIAIALLLVRS